jgi:hypothetical protein
MRAFQGPDEGLVEGTRLDNPPYLTTRQLRGYEPLTWNLLDADLQSIVCSWSRRNGRQRCNRWKCTACALAKGKELAEDICWGLRWAESQALRVRFYTITDGADTPLSLEEFNRRWSRFCSNLGASGLRWHHYVATLGANPVTGRLHRHVVAIGGRFVPKGVLSTFAQRAGIGYVDIREVRPTRQDRRGVANYVAGNAARYALMHQASGARIQPVSRSHPRTS